MFHAVGPLKISARTRTGILSIAIPFVCERILVFTVTWVGVRSFLRSPSENLSCTGTWELEAY
jgi:hypothetical protein